MPTFITIGYGSQEGYERTDERVLTNAHEADARLVEAGVIMGIAGAPMQVRHHDASGVDVRSGAFMQSELPVAGFAIIEAADIDEAIAKVAQSPCAVAQGVVEVWPLST